MLVKDNRKTGVGTKVGCLLLKGYATYFSPLKHPCLMTHYLLFVLLACTAFGCAKQEFDRLEDCIEGTWSFTNAEHRTLNHSTYNSVYHHYYNDELSFYDDKTALYREANGDNLVGVWDLHRVDGDDDGANYLLSIALEHPQNGLVQYVWEVQGMCSGSWLRATGITSDYEFCYQLEKE